MPDNDKPRLDHEKGISPKPEDSLKVVSAQELFGDEREICIEHEGERYRLRITRRGKLILQK